MVSRRLGIARSVVGKGALRRAAGRLEHVVVEVEAMLQVFRLMLGT